ncbi:MAG: putative ABC transport system ATP-binding protein, partial [Sphingobacteriales bacterium]
KKRDAFRGKQIGFIPQTFSFAESLTAWDHFRLFSRWSKSSVSKPEVLGLLQEIGIQDSLDKKPTDLSGGEQQRLAIALGVFHNPSVIIADEPTSQLDDKNCQDVIDLLVQLQKTHPFALLIISHDQRLKNQFSNLITL